MGKKGIFFAFIVFLIVMAVLLVNLSISQSTSKQNEAVADQSAFDSVNNRFNDIYNRTISIKTGERGYIQGRILPFNYTSGTDWILIQQYLPFLNAQTVYDITFDSLNLYKIFATNNDISNEYATSITPQKNYCPSGCWETTGGTTPDFTTVILPQCLSIEPAKPADITQLLLRKGTTGAFDFCPSNFPANTGNAIKKIEVTIDFSTNSDVLSPQCTGSFNCNTSSCTNPNGNLCVEIHLKIPSCSPQCSGACCLASPEQIIAANITQASSVNVPFNTGGYANISVENGNEILKINEDSLETKGILATTKITFVNPIQELRFNGFQSLSVSKPNFDINRKSS